LRRVARILELDEDQREAVKALLAEHREKITLLMNDIRESAGSVRELVENEASAEEIGERVKSLHQFRRELRELGEEIQTEFEALLTEEQLLKYEAIKEFVHSFKGRHGRWGGRGHFGESFEGYLPPER
jgi:Spy/CpxP family protein refolding chaperone